jgi:hypothetical protein
MLPHPGGTLLKCCRLTDPAGAPPTPQSQNRHRLAPRDGPRIPRPPTSSADCPYPARVRKVARHIRPPPSRGIPANPTPMLNDRRFRQRRAHANITLLDQASMAAGAGVALIRAPSGVTARHDRKTARRQYCAASTVAGRCGAARPPARATSRPCGCCSGAARCPMTTTGTWPGPPKTPTSACDCYPATASTWPTAPRWRPRSAPATSRGLLLEAGADPNRPVHLYGSSHVPASACTGDGFT